MLQNSLKILLIISLGMFFACNQGDAKRRAILLDEDAYTQDGREKHAQLEYDEDFHDFGTIKHGEVVSYTFSFRNTGNIPLIIYDVVVGCGCTKPKVSNDLLKPNEKASMDVVFDSRGWRGVQYKSVTIRSNGVQPQKSVTIKANIE